MLIIFFCCLALPAQPQAAGDVQDVDRILNAAESLFMNMSQAAYPALWKGLSTQSKKTIVQNVHKAIAKAGVEYAEERIRADFAAGGELAREYWANYVVQFEPRLVLEESKWSMGPVKEDTAEIIIRHRKSDRDAILKMLKEEGAWKVGLEETFSTRR